MGKSIYKKAKHVLVFNGAQVLIAIVRSLRSASELTGGNTQAISFVCTGKYISTGGFYFRHLHPDILIEISDLNTLKIQEYDKMCGEERKYHTIREMAKLRNEQIKRIRR
ncbi:hypothetical protein [Bacteroides sp. 51]|uniref:hypothetical protein n=1 Tax=Bacteroides sp. 51 TaxID=2302938 RepID=UPI0013D7F286|nr:hypothetical protein [Bacteroides sp. 51]NDV80812.1 hypothetical protein [Bacteroides sp. 51]